MVDVCLSLFTAPSRSLVLCRNLRALQVGDSVEELGPSAGRRCHRGGFRPRARHSLDGSRLLCPWQASSAMDLAEQL